MPSFTSSRFSSFPSAWQLHIQHPLSTIFPLHMSKPSQPCVSNFVSKLLNLDDSLPLYFWTAWGKVTDEKMETVTACTAVISHTVFRCCCLFIPGTYTGEGVKLWMFLITRLCVYNHPTWHIWKSYQTQISHRFDFIKQYEELKSLWQMVPSLSGQMWDCSQRCSTHLWGLHCSTRPSVCVYSGTLLATSNVCAVFSSLMC